MQLRAYQEQGVERVRSAYLNGRRAPLFVLPTGAGKTFVFAWMTMKAAARGNRVLILVHRQELLKQASRSLSVLEVPHGLIAPRQHGERDTVAVASVQTLDRRLQRGPVHFDFVIVDEAHHCGAATWNRVLSHFPDAKILGVTATPIRLDGRGLGASAGGVFDELIEGPTISELIADGHLVEPIVYAYPSELDLGGLRKSGGDFNQRELAKRVDKPRITGDAVEHYARLCPGEPAIAFCASLEHAEHVTDQFKAGGFSAAVIHGGLSDTERQELLAGLASGRIQVLASVDLISEGTDVPSCSVAILLRATESLGLYLQMVGRVLRPAPGKTRAIVLDHVGNCLKHGLPSDDREWTLEGVSRKANGEQGLVIRQCRKCFAVFEKGIRCPHCGNVNISETSRKPLQVAGELREITKMEMQTLKKARAKAKKIAYARATSYGEVLELTRKFGDEPGYAYIYWTKIRKARGG